VALVGVVPLGPAPSPAAASQASCWASGCDGRLVSESDCMINDPIDVGGFQIPLSDPATPAVAYYSPACHAVWYEFRTPSSAEFLHFQLWWQPTYGGVQRLMKGASGSAYERVAGTTDRYRSVMASWDYSIKGCYGTQWSSDGEPSHPYGGCSSWT